MRCLTLADGLKQQGMHIRFISRHLPEYLQNLLVKKGHEFVILNSIQNDMPIDELAHANWLGVSQEQDATDSVQALSDLMWDWIIVDHYALDVRWEKMMRQFAQNIMVIDDLVDRKHDCDLLLDQTYRRKKEEYKNRVPRECKLLTGSKYSLLRPEFSDFRKTSLKRRIEPKLKNLLVSLGGVDEFNFTGKVLQELQISSLPKDCQITIVMGRTAPWISSVREQARKLPWKTKVEVDVHNIAKLMSESDLAFGAAGSTAWERCCLGLPTIMLVLADNQKDIAKALDEEHAVILLNNIFEVKYTIDSINEQPKKLQNLSKISSKVTDGSGLKFVSQYISKFRA